MQWNGRMRVHLVQQFQDLLEPRRALGGILGTDDPLRRLLVSRQTAVLLLAAIIAFGGCLWGSFHFDDYSLFSNGLWRPLEIRPLTYVTFWLNQWLGGRNPAGYHAVNLLLHLAAIVLLFETLKRLISTQAAFIAAAVFAVHPFQAEPVNYIFARSTLLATVLCLAALTNWVRGRVWWATAWFAAALLAKEECVAFPVFLLLLHFSRSRDSKELKPIGAMFALAAAAGFRVLLAAQSTPGSGAGAQAAISWQSYFLTQGAVILRYLRMLLVPLGFTVDADIQTPTLWLAALAWVGVLALAGIAAFQFTNVRAGFWFLVGLVLLLPSSSIFPATDLAADRRIYLPMIGFAACAALLLAKLRPIYLAVMLILLAGVSITRTATWRNEESLWTDAVAKAPTKIRPRIQLARAVEADRALLVLEQAKGIAPDDARIPAEEGRIYLSLGRPGQALPEFGRALALSPRSVEAMNNRGVALLALDQKEAARADFERALAIDPCQFDARLNLSRLGISKPAPPECRYSPEQAAALRGN
jgi:tetratricopeptide (TPR) repeat protein